MALTSPLLCLPATTFSPQGVGFPGASYEPLSQMIVSASKDDDGPSIGGAPTTPRESALVAGERETEASSRSTYLGRRAAVARLSSVYVSRGRAGDAANLALKWAVMGSLAYFLPSPWGWLAAAAAMGAMAVFNTARLGAYFSTAPKSPRRYEAKYGVLMRRIDFSWKEMVRYSRDGTAPLYERQRQYRELLAEIRSTMTELEALSLSNPGRVMARGSVTGIYLMLTTPWKDEGLRHRYERESLVRSCRRFVNSLPGELPVLPPESEEAGSYRELPARLRVEVPEEFSDFEDELAEIEDEREEKKGRS
ncbi:MAG TPA: hypothetical protein VFX30_02285 [bacterium]|nr:hypothetical protein [bacterium]